MAQWMARRGSSLAFLSRQPVVSYRWRRPAWSQHAILELVPQEGLAVFGVHLSAIHSNWTEWRRDARSARPADDGQGRRRTTCRSSTGDFNTLAPGEALDLARLPARLRAVTWLTGSRIRWKTVALMLEAGYVDAFRLVEPDGPRLHISDMGPAPAAGLRLHAGASRRACFAVAACCSPTRLARRQTICRLRCRLRCETWRPPCTRWLRRQSFMKFRG